MFHNKILLGVVVLGSTWMPMLANAESFPKHAVLAFNLAKCPEGWTLYSPAKGAFVVGVGEPFKLGAGGASSMDKWILTSDQLPSLEASATVSHWPVDPGIENTASAAWALMETINPGLQLNPLTLTVSGGKENPKPIPLPKVSGLLFCEKL